MYQGQTLFGASFKSMAPDGSRIYSAGNTFVKVAPDGSVWNSTNGTSWNPTNTLIDDSGNTSLNPSQGGASDIIGGLSNTVKNGMPADTLGDTLTTLAKASPAVIAPAVLAGLNPGIASIFGMGGDGADVSALGDLSNLDDAAALSDTANMAPLASESLNTPLVSGLPGELSSVDVSGAADMLPGAEFSASGGGPASMLSTGSKIANLADNLSKLNNGVNGLSTDGGTPRGNAAASAAAQLAQNRYLAARADQGGPAADAQAFRNQMRAAIVAKMNPNAAPLSLNGHALPTLANADTVSGAAALRDALAKRVAAGKSATTFGVPDPTAQETALSNSALSASGLNGGVNGAMGDVTDAINTGSKIANLANNGFKIGTTIGSWF